MMRPVLLSFAAMLLCAAGPVEDFDEHLAAGEPDKALELAQATYAAGDPAGAEMLGYLYRAGEGVEVDAPRAAGYFAEAAAAGRAYSQWAYGVMLDTGEGVAEDPQAAFEWIRKAERQDLSDGAASLAVMYALGRGTAVDYDEAMRLYMKCARQGNPAGLFGVGVLHDLGQGVPQDRAEAMAWYLVAGENGDQRAATNFQLYADEFDEAALDAIYERANEIVGMFRNSAEPEARPI